jgi:hypothetical protein
MSSTGIIIPQSGIGMLQYRTKMLARCRNTDAGCICLNADAQLCMNCFGINLFKYQSDQVLSTSAIVVIQGELNTMTLGTDNIFCRRQHTKKCPAEYLCAPDLK